MSELGAAPPQGMTSFGAAPPGDSQGSAAGDGVPPMGGLLPHMEQGLQRSGAMYDKIREIQGRASVVRTQLDELMKLQDMITQEDLVHAASKLVAHGIGAAEIAGILSEAPDGGPALQGWIAQRDQALRQQEAQLNQMAALTRHQMGVDAMRLMAAHSMAAAHGFGMDQQMTSPQAANPAAGAANDLTGQVSGGPAEGPAAPNAMGAE